MNNKTKKKKSSNPGYYFEKISAAELLNLKNYLCLCAKIKLKT